MMFGKGRHIQGHTMTQKSQNLQTIVLSKDKMYYNRGSQPVDNSPLGEEFQGFSQGIGATDW